MFLIIDEWETPHQVTELTDVIIDAFEVGVMSIMRYNPDTNRFEEYDSGRWKDIATWG
jgi:hypothetical protein